MSERMLPKVGVAVFIWRDNKFLVPGGSVRTVKALGACLAAIWNLANRLKIAPGAKQWKKPV